MLQCKNCGEKLTKFQKERCPYCGCEKPIEDMVDISDTTQTIEQIRDEELEFSEKSLKTYNIFSILLGLFSADLFYLGFKTQGFMRLLINFGIWLIAFLTIFLIDNSLVIIAIFVPLAVLYLVYVIYGLFKLIKQNRIKDKNGVHLK